MIDQAGRIKRLEENIAIIAQYLSENPPVGSIPEEGQSRITGIVWDNNLQKVEVKKESQEE
ncbi:MAG: hypothetical protein KKC55_13975 [Gammaproteobacteria bacterium]|nr:hypothetical protein [Gammaproteobacteria bacterium]